MTPSEFYTAQFYTWEYRGRGWHLADFQVDLEPPFVPFFRHGFPEVYTDDGKRPTVLSKLLDSFRNAAPPVVIPQSSIAYETLEPFPSDEQDLVAVQLKLPREDNVSSVTMKAVLLMLSPITGTCAFEIIGNSTEIVFQFVCPEEYKDLVETYVQVYFPSLSLQISYTENILQQEKATAVMDFGLRNEFMRPLHVLKELAVDPITGILATLEHMPNTAQGGIQILFQPVINQWSESIIRSVTMGDGSSFFYDAPEGPQLAKDKVRSPLYAVTIRAFAQAHDLTSAFGLLEKISNALIHGSKGLHNELLPLASTSYDFTLRTQDIYTRQSHRLGMLLNLDELLMFVHIPSDYTLFQKLFASNRRTKAVPDIAIGKELLIGNNIHNGITATVTCDTIQRLKHTHIIGATGTGKSTLIAQLVLQDIAKGSGVVLLDPHGDLVDEITGRISEERLDDVVLLDPSDGEFPVGLNILEANSDIEKEVLSSDLVAIFKKYATSWGDQMSTVLGNAIHALLESSQGGSLHELRRFLIEKEYRAFILRTVHDPAIVYYWQNEYPLLKSNSIGPILTRLDTFLRPKAIRNMVVQKKGIDFAALLHDNKIILCKLSQGLIGVENSFLLGSLILIKLHQAILKRQDTAARSTIFIYLDEFQNFSTPSLREMISGIRKYQVGLILAHQDLHQLHRDDGELLNTVLSNVGTRIVFRIGEGDAKRLQDGFNGFDYTDMQNLGQGEAIIRIEQPRYDCSLTTLPLPTLSDEAKTDKRTLVIAHSRYTYARTKAAVEEELFASFGFKEPEVPKPQQEKKEPAKTASAFPVPPKEKIDPIHPLPDEKNISAHRYLQALVKKMAEAKGYTATLEMPLPEGGSIDVVLAKEGKTIAVEICNTTDADWEVHNILKCIPHVYSHIVSLCGDIKQLDKIRKRLAESIPTYDPIQILFYTPDAFFEFLHEGHTEPNAPDEKIMKGYRVNVKYDAITEEEMKRKRASVAQVVMHSLRKKGK